VVALQVWLSKEIKTTFALSLKRGRCFQKNQVASERADERARNVSKQLKIFPFIKQKKKPLGPDMASDNLMMAICCCCRCGRCGAAGGRRLSLVLYR